MKEQSKTQFTPGPWKLATASWPPNSAKDMAISESSGTLIVARAEYANFPRCQDRANAHLIAAAPELFGALKQMLSETGYPSDQCFPDSTFGKAYAAIAKAEGRARDDNR